MQYTLFPIANWFSYKALINFSWTLAFIANVHNAREGGSNINVGYYFHYVSKEDKREIMKQSYRGDIAEHRAGKRCAVAHHSIVFLPSIPIARTVVKSIKIMRKWWVLNMYYFLKYNLPPTSYNLILIMAVFNSWITKFLKVWLLNLVSLWKWL